MNKIVDIIPERNVNDTKGKGRCSHDFMMKVLNNSCARIVFVGGKAEIIPLQTVSNKNNSGGGHE